MLAVAPTERQRQREGVGYVPILVPHFLKGDGPGEGALPYALRPELPVDVRNEAPNELEAVRKVPNEDRNDIVVDGSDDDRTKPFG